MTALRTAILTISLLAASRSAAEALPDPVSPPASTAAAPAPVTSAQEASVAPEPSVSRIGLGVGIGAGGTPDVLYVPMDWGPLRIEPSIAYARLGIDDADAARTLLGLGLFGLAPIAPTIRCDVGVRAQYLRDKVSGESASEAILAAAVLGGEWVPAPYFSLGVEGRVAYTFALGNRVDAVDVSAQAVLRVFLSTVKSTPRKIYGTAPAREANTATKVTQHVKLQIPAGKANPDSPVGPALAEHGVDVPEFCKQFNAATQAQEGVTIPVVVTVYEDRSFTFELKPPRARPAPLTTCQQSSDCQAPDICFAGYCRH